MGELVDVYDGVHQTPDYQDSGIMFLSVENISTLKSNKYISTEAFERDYKVYPEKGDILMTRIGDIGTTNVVESTDKMAFYVSLALLKLKDLDSYFLSNAMKNEPFQKGLRQRSLLTAIPQKINKEEIGKTDIFITKNPVEQKKIGEYFSTLDHLITLHQRKCDDTKELKKYMLQKMFPKNGEKFPEIRFKGFTEAWEQRKFGDLADYKKGPFGSAITKDMFVPKSDDSIKVYEQQNAISKDWTLERYFLPHGYALTKLKAFEVHGGDIIVSCAGTIGEIYEIPENAERGVINQALMRVRVNKEIINKKLFIIAFSNMIDNFTRTHSNGSAIKNIPPFADLKPMEVLIPPMDEQKKISGYFENLDNLITLHRRAL